MYTKQYLQNSLIVGLGLLVLTMLSKLLNDSPQSMNTQAGVELINNSLKWRKIASQDSQPFMKVQHNMFAIAYINAARHIARDIELEKLTGIDLRKLLKSIDEQLQLSIDSLNTRCPKLRGKISSITF